MVGQGWGLLVSWIADGDGLSKFHFHSLMSSAAEFMMFPPPCFKEANC